MVDDTPQNRALLENTTVPSNFKGVDTYGNKWYVSFDEFGRQIWVSTRSGSIRDGGINIYPRAWDSETGYCRNPRK